MHAILISEGSQEVLECLDCMHSNLFLLNPSAKVSLVLLILVSLGEVMLHLLSICIHHAHGTPRCQSFIIVRKFIGSVECSSRSLSTGLSKSFITCNISFCLNPCILIHLAIVKVIDSNIFISIKLSVLSIVTVTNKYIFQ